MLDQAIKTMEKTIFCGLSEPSSPLSLAEKMEALFPSVWIMIATLGSLCVVMIILTKFLYNPIQKMIQRRKEFIKQNIDESIKAKNEAYDLKNEARAKLIESKSTSQDIISRAKTEAEIIKNDYIKQGKEEADRLIREAKDEIKTKKQNLENEMHNEILSIAIEISQKIIEDKINEKEAQKYLNNYFGKN